MQTASKAIKALKPVLRFSKRPSTSTAAAAAAPAAAELPLAPEPEPEPELEPALKVAVELPADLVAHGCTLPAWAKFQDLEVFRANPEAQPYIVQRAGNYVRSKMSGSTPCSADKALEELGNDMMQKFDTGVDLMNFLACMATGAAQYEVAGLEAAVHVFYKGDEVKVDSAVQQAQELQRAVDAHKCRMLLSLGAFSVSPVTRGALAVTRAAGFDAALPNLVPGQATKSPASMRWAMHQCECKGGDVINCQANTYPFYMTASDLVCAAYQADAVALNREFCYIFHEPLTTLKLDEGFGLHRELLAGSVRLLRRVRAAKQAMGGGLEDYSEVFLTALLKILPNLLVGGEASYMETSTSLLVELQHVATNRNAAAAQAADSKAERAGSKADRAVMAAKAAAEATIMTSRRVDKQARRLERLEQQVQLLSGKRKLPEGDGGSEGEEEEPAAKRRTPTLPHRYQATAVAMAAAASPAPRSALRELNSHPLTTGAAAKVAAAAGQPTPAVAAAVAAAAGGCVPRAAAVVAAQAAADSDSDSGGYIEMEVHDHAGY